MSTARLDGPRMFPDTSMVHATSIRNIRQLDAPTELAEHTCIILTTRQKFTLFISIPNQNIQVFDIKYRPDSIAPVTWYASDNTSPAAIDQWIHETISTLKLLFYFIDSFPLTFYVEHVSNAHFVLFMYFVNREKGDLERADKEFTDLLSLSSLPEWPHFLGKYVVPNISNMACP